MTRRHWRLTGIAALAVLCLRAAVPWQESRFTSQLRDQIVAAIRDRDTVALARVASWQRLGVFGPYTSDDVISKAMQFDSRLSQSSGIAYSDSICLVVLVMSTGDVEDIVVSRGIYDLCSINGGLLPLVLDAGDLREPASW